MDLLAGVEAIISHLIVEEFKIPAAHAPANLPFPPSASLSPKSAAEEVNSLLPCQIKHQDMLLISLTRFCIAHVLAN